jgi:hypothetical protein
MGVKRLHGVHLIGIRIGVCRTRPAKGSRATAPVGSRRSPAQGGTYGARKSPRTAAERNRPKTGVRVPASPAGTIDPAGVRKESIGEFPQLKPAIPSPARRPPLSVLSARVGPADRSSFFGGRDLELTSQHRRHVAGRIPRLDLKAISARRKVRIVRVDLRRPGAPLGIPPDQSK